MFNRYYPEPITSYELASIVKNAVSNKFNRRLNLEIKVMDTGKASLSEENCKLKSKIDVSKITKILNVNHLISPKESVERIILGQN